MARRRVRPYGGPGGSRFDHRSMTMIRGGAAQRAIAAAKSKDAAVKAAGRRLQKAVKAQAEAESVIAGFNDDTDAEERERAELAAEAAVAAVRTAEAEVAELS